MPTTTTAYDAGTLRIGNDLEVRRMGYGTMCLTGTTGPMRGEPANPQETIRVLRRAVELGVNLLDTASYYGPGVSNRLIREALYPYPADLVICSKVGARHTPDGHIVANVRPEEIRADIELNLRQLSIEALPIVHFRHSPSDVPFEESVGEMSRLQANGLIRYVGVSNVTIDELRQAQRIVPIATVQNAFSPFHRGGMDLGFVRFRNEAGLAEICAGEGIPFMPFFTLASWKGQGPELLQRIARRHGATPHQVTLAWSLAHTPTMLPIPGTGSVAHLEENVAAAALRLSAEEMEELNNLGA